MAGNHSAISRMPTTNPAPTNASRNRAIAAVVKLSARAKKRQRMPEIASNAEYMRRGPTLSTSMPTTMRAGMVSATLRIRSAETSWSVSLSELRIAAISGA